MIEIDYSTKHFDELIVDNDIFSWYNTIIVS